MREPPRCKALACRSAAALAVLWQIRLFSGELSSAPFFALVLLEALALPVALALARPSRAAGKYAVCAVILLVPPAVRLCVAAPGLVLPALAGAESLRAALLFDGFLLAYDRTMFAALFPFYWLALSTFAALRRPPLVRAAALADLALLVALFLVFKSAPTDVWSRPALKMIVFLGVVALELFALVLAAPRAARLTRRETALSAALLLCLAAACGGVLWKTFSDRALERGGGLLKPGLFSFDFAPFLRLENEIGMNDDLVFIVRLDGGEAGPDRAQTFDGLRFSGDGTDGGGYAEAGDYAGDEDYAGEDETDGARYAGAGEDGAADGADERFFWPDRTPPRARTSLVRRFSLSAYDSAAGFTRDAAFDERVHRRLLPQSRERFPVSGGAAREPVSQEYYLVNIDGGAFIGMNEPYEAAPFERWDASSFKAAYRVESLVAAALTAELARPFPGGACEGLGEAEAAFLTRYGDPKKGLDETERRVRDLALALTADAPGYLEKIEAVYLYLKYGDYLYSLKPGIAPRGNQLEYFLFESKKGYCSYFAFAFASMLRSLGVPCRVAVGFFLDPASERLGFYPVTANMAHAWVEVWFPGYGWIEYDPTTEELAPGEQWNFSAGPPGETLERLMKEILENRARLKEKTGAAEEPDAGALSEGERAAARAARGAFGLLLAALCAGFIYTRFSLYIRFLIARDARKKTALLYDYANTLAGGERGAAGGPERPAPGAADMLDLYALRQKARFARSFSPADFDAAREAFARFSRARKRDTPLWKRALRRLFPRPPGGRRGPGGRLLAVCAFLTHAAAGGGGLFALEGADELFARGREARDGKRWEQAIEHWARGKNDFPADARFGEALGDLYAGRELYRLALPEYEAALRARGEDAALLKKLADACGSLNDDARAARYLERSLAVEPDDTEALAMLGWMYFKLRRLDDGKALIADAARRLGSNPNFAMTLGTLNTGLLRYDEAKAAYEEAVSSAARAGYADFAATAAYNFSLLESGFYHYEEAYRKAERSLDYANRATGHLALGELHFRRLDWKAGLGEYRAAYDMDRSPLSALSLADTFRLCGRLEEARAYAEDCLSRSGNAWMLNYGINMNEYKRDIHEILYAVYFGLEKTERFSPPASPAAAVRSLWKRARFWAKGAAHQKLFYKYALLSARDFKAEPSAARDGRDALDMYALDMYARAFEAYPARAPRYLAPAREESARRVPASAASYVLREALASGDAGLLERAVPLLDPVWERDLLAEAYARLCARGGKNAGRYAEILYALNPGALRQNGIRLPARFECGAGPEGRALEKQLAGRGFRPQKAGESRYVLRVSGEGRFAHVELFDTARAFALVRENVEPAGGGAAAKAEAAANAVFTVR